MAHSSSINVTKQEDNFKSQCEREVSQMNPMAYNVGVIFEDETIKENAYRNPTTSSAAEVPYCPIFHNQEYQDTSGLHDPEHLYKVLTPLQRDYNTNLLQQQYNPRRLIPQISLPTIHKEHYKENQVRCVEKGEIPRNLDTAMQVKLNHEDGQKIDVCMADPQKNILIDYKTLRKSGYYLKCGTNHNNLTVIDPMNLEISKVDQVQSWLACMPEDVAYLKDSDDDIMGKTELQNTNLNVNLPKFTSEEDEFKYMLLSQGNSLKFPSNPSSTLTYKQLESILEAANMQIFGYLERNQKYPERLEHEYVNGTFEIPPSWKNQKQQMFRANESRRASPLEVIKSWIYYVGSFIVNGKGVDSTVDINDIGTLHSEEVGKVMLKPYHGPVKVNGAMIESGSTKPILHKGTLGNVIEEVKAALQAINDSLRKEVSPKISLAESEQTPAGKNGGDAEIKRLTELIQKKKIQKKARSRTVFGLKNPDKIPTYALHIRRRRQMAMRNGHNNGFFRVVSGWIQRKAHHRPARPQIHLNANNAPINQSPLSLSQQNERSTTENNHASGSFFISSFTGIRNALRSFGAQFQLQLNPAVPASVNHDNQHEGQIENFRRHWSNLRGETLSGVPPTRYRIARNNERRGRNYNSRRMFAARML